MMLLAPINLVIVFLLSVSEVISQCPPSSGIYLRYDENCYPNGSYFSDSSIRPTPLECGLPGATLNGGQWIGPNGEVPCDGGNNANVECTTGSGSAGLSISINPPSFLEALGDGWYKCCLPTDCSDPNTNSIFANIFRFAQIESFTVADLPSDMTVYPQKFKLNCVKIGFIRYDVMMSIDSTLLANYTNCHDPDNTCPGTVLVSSTNTIRYTVTVTWDGMTVSNGLIGQSITGDQMYQCRIADHPDGNEIRMRNVTVKVPATAPSSFSVVNKTATSITISWTAFDSSDADGYVVNVTSDTGIVRTVQVDMSSNNTITLNRLSGGTTYNITVRAYQQLLGPASTISVFTHLCQQEGIYLTRFNERTCYPNGSYFWDSTVNSDTEAISCVLPSTSLTTGQWVRVADPDDPVDCNINNDNDPFRCANATSPDAILNLYLAQGLRADQEGWYKCCLPTDCSDPNTNIIFANIFRFSEIESFTVADLPSDMTVYPQVYQLNCTKIGHHEYGISMNIGSTALASYTRCNDASDDSPCPGIELVSSSNTIRYTVDVTWDGMTVSSGLGSQSTTGDQMYQCIVEVTDQPIKRRNVIIKVPVSGPSSLTEVNKTINTITVSWTALDSSDADGYVVNVTNDTDTVQTVQVEGSSNNTITLNGLRIETTYNITVRAYQQLLGPASTISVQTLPVINSINQTLVSSITQLNNTQYRIDCITTTNINPSSDVYWLVNGVMINNSNYSSIDVLTYNNTLLVYPDPLGVSVNVTCKAMLRGVNYSQSVILHAPSGPPNNVRGFILNATSIKVNWTISSETNGYVIEYTTGGITNVVSTSEDEIVLTDLSPMNTYTISVYSYIDLPSVNSTVTVLKFDVPSRVTNLLVSNVSTTNITLNWTIPSSDNYVTYYTIISYTSSCPESSLVNETVSVAPHQSTTTYSYTLIGLYSGMNYTITVRAGNVLGESNSSLVYEDTQPSGLAPTGEPNLLSLLQPINNLTWNEVNCSDRNGIIKGYRVMISNSSITYNLTSTKRYIILNGLVIGTEYNISVAAVNSFGTGPFSSINVFIHCQREDIYLKYNGNCYPNGSYFWDSTVNSDTEAISCVLPGTSLTTGQWVRVADPDDPIDCNSNNASDPFRCTSIISPDATLSLYLAQGLPAEQEGWYKCCLPTDCSNATDIIFANIFRFSEIESLTVADLPSDMTVYPQKYKLNCVKIGFYLYGISMSISNTTLANYTNCDDRVSNYPCFGTVLASSSNTVRYTVNITWDGMTVSSGSISQSTTGDHMYQCLLDNPSGGVDRTRTLTIKVPPTAPSSLTEENKTISSVTVSWTALDSSDADGYVVNVTNDTDTVQTVQVEGSSNDTITLDGLRGGTTYNITVRAYQQLLGPASSAISVHILGPAQIDRFKELPDPRDNEVVQGAGRRKQPVYGHQNNIISLHCNYRSRVPANTQWFRVFLNGTQVPVDTNDSAINVTDDGMNSLLTIFPFSQRFAGTYRCNTSNEAGCDIADVIVKYEPLVWFTFPWSQCVPDCHRGVRNRTVVCMTLSTRMIIMDGCSPPPPPSQERCYQKGPCTHWVVGPWSTCSKSCGVGYQIRRVQCQATYNSSITLSDSECLTARPPVFRYCNFQDCPCSEPSYCKVILGTELCWRSEYQRTCCHSCA